MTEQVPAKFKKPYNPQETEPAIYKKWEESGYFNPDSLVALSAEERGTDVEARGQKPRFTEPFCIVMPPPNVTGVLHMGHALMLTLEDILIRYKRMQGFKTLWLPGTDHAAIATQSVVEKEISKKEGKSRHDVGREELMRRVEAFAKQSHDRIIFQVKTLGASCDWSREAFTLDETRSRAVNAVFKMMFDDGLIYRGHRIVNWDPKGQTTISDDEIAYEERPAKLYTFRYSKDFPFAVSTTRPETKVGDTAVAVHPDDARYKDYIGKEYSVVFCDVPLTIRIVADKAANMEFGTGAVGVTPAHSSTDADIAARHDLPAIQVIDERARMMVEGRLSEKKVLEAREEIVAWLTHEGLLEKEEDIVHNVATAERTGGIIEPLPKLQWFVDVNKQIPSRENLPAGKAGKTLKELMREPVANGSIKILPDHFEKIYFHWIDNLRDWCISRQIWYGHRIPVWYRRESDPSSTAKLTTGHSAEVTRTDAEDEAYVGITPPEGEGWIQDPDTLDTWFSSGLWTFSTFGWPDKTKDLEAFHPTDVLETGYDILFFWVARMILMSEYALGTIPFKTVYLHGMVRDTKGQKMSKSLGNNLDPMDIAEKFGADASRMALVVGNTPGTDMRISEDKIKAYKLFANKIWNIARFVLEQTDDTHFPLNQADAALRKEFETVANDITVDMEGCRLYMASEKVYHYLWDTFASTLLEESKAILKGDDAQARASRSALLRGIFSDSLKLLHPFMPFVTEEIWGALRHKEDPELLMVASWPKLF